MTEGLQNDAKVVFLQLLRHKKGSLSWSPLRRGSHGTHVCVPYCLTGDVGGFVGKAYMLAAVKTKCHFPRSKGKQLYRASAD